MHNISHNDVAHPAIPLATCQLLLIGQLTGSPTFSAALALLVVSRPVARECRGNVRAGNVQGAMSVSRCIVVVNKSRRRSTSCCDGRARRGWMHKVYHTLVTVTKKMCGLNKQKLVVMAMSLERSQPNFTAIIYAYRAINSENSAKIGRVYFEEIGLESSKNWKHFRKLGSFKVIKNGIIRQITYDFLFDFQSNHMPISCRFGDIA